MEVTTGITCTLTMRLSTTEWKLYEQRWYYRTWQYEWMMMRVATYCQRRARSLRCSWQRLWWDPGRWQEVHQSRWSGARWLRQAPLTAAPSCPSLSPSGSPPWKTRPCWRIPPGGVASCEERQTGRGQHWLVYMYTQHHCLQLISS